MTPSPEYLALKALGKPQQAGCGDMWLCRRLGIVVIYNGHKRGRGCRSGRSPLNSFHLYHWHQPSLTAKPDDFRDGGTNTSGIDVARHPSGETWEFIGNIFEMLPYASLAGAQPSP